MEAIAARPRRIAVLRANGIGDFIFAEPALDALRAAHPAAEIVLLGKPWHASFLAGRDAPVDRVEVVPPLRGVSRPDDYQEGDDGESEALEAFYARMQAQHFDLALQMHGGGRHSNPFTLRLGARATAGFQAPEAAALDLTVPYRYYQHEVMRFIELAMAIGAPPRRFEPRLSVMPADRAEAAAVLEALGYDEAKSLVVLAPGAGDLRRRWPAERFADTARAIRETGAFIVIIGDESDSPLAEEIAFRSGSGVASAAGRLSLGGVLGVLERACLAVCNDTGPHHLAAAVGTRTIGIFWAGSLVNAAPFTRARHRVFASWRMACPRCGADCTVRRCDHQVSYVADVPASEVIAEALDLMG